MAQNRTCRQCGSDTFQKGPGPDGVWAGFRLIPVICAKCRHSAGYGIAASLPRFDPPRGEAAGSNYEPFGRPASKPAAPWSTPSPRSARRRGRTVRSVRALVTKTFTLAVGLALLLFGVPFGIQIAHGAPLATAFPMTADDYRVLASCPDRWRDVWRFVNRDDLHISGANAVDAVCRNNLYAESVPLSSPGEPRTGSVTPTSPNWRESIPGLERAVHEQGNQYRDLHSLPTLEYVLTIAQVARGHSAHMSAGNFFDHVTPEGQTVDDRFAGTGLYCGENIVMLPRATAASSVSGVIVHRENDILQMAESDLAGYVVQSWIESPGHRENMLLEHYGLGGVGIHYNESDEQLFATHNMCTT